LLAISGLVHGWSPRRLTANDPIVGAAVAVPIVAELRRSRGGRPLPEGPGNTTGDGVGFDTSVPRIRSDPAGGAIADSLRARAFTRSDGFDLAPGANGPGTRAGQRVSAYELGHVAAHCRGADRASGGVLLVGRVGNPTGAEADCVADSVMAALLSRSPGRSRLVPVSP
jgi:hypothetical protein